MHTFEVVGPPVRLGMEEQDTSHRDGITIVDVVYGDAGAVPQPQPGIENIVSLVTGLALAGRSDIVVPYREVRGPSGSVIGCRALARPCLQQAGE
ncbi:hypothetical protein [Streptomyces noursei]|uniref:Uncharacterized protein n=1 Tax=Streptomyces noursei TaxID=1971 RepID=A0A2N8PQY0_STRNR|nr:hypothetical protein [Streptomyces noursei]PNE43445.1 hypothetical protein AOB60_00490 [Streptomyces noursei]